MRSAELIERTVEIVIPETIPHSRREMVVLLTPARAATSD
jgi:hypothetical protein